MTTYKREQEQEPIRTQEPNTFTYGTSSGNVRIIYYSLTGKVEITNSPKNEFLQRSYSPKDTFVLAPQDTLEIGIYLLGLQPHIRDVLARKEQPVPQAPLEDDLVEDNHTDEAVSDD